MITPDLLNEKLDQWGENILQGAIAEIETFDKIKLRAKIQPLLKKKRKDEFEKLPVIIDVPVNTFYANGYLIIPDYKKGDRVWIGISSFPVSNSVKGQFQNITANKFGLENAVILGSFMDTPLNPVLKKDGLVIAHKSGDVYLNITDSEIKCRVKEKQMVLKSSGLEITGDVIIKGKLEVDEDITWMKKTKPGKASKHNHMTPTGPSSAYL